MNSLGPQRTSYVSTLILAVCYFYQYVLIWYNLINMLQHSLTFRARCERADADTNGGEGNGLWDYLRKPEKRELLDKYLREIQKSYKLQESFLILNTM